MKPIIQYITATLMVLAIIGLLGFIAASIYTQHVIDNL